MVTRVGGHLLRERTSRTRIGDENLSDKIHYDISRGWTALQSAESSIISPPLHRAGLTIFPTTFTTPVPAAQPPAAQHRSPVQPSGNCPCNQQQILNTPAKTRARQQFPPTASAGPANDCDHVQPTNQDMAVQPINSWPVPIDAPACRSAILLEPVSGQA